MTGLLTSFLATPHCSSFPLICRSLRLLPRFSEDTAYPLHSRLRSLPFPSLPPSPVPFCQLLIHILPSPVLFIAFAFPSSEFRPARSYLTSGLRREKRNSSCSLLHRHRGLRWREAGNRPLHRGVKWCVFRCMRAHTHTTHPHVSPACARTGVYLAASAAIGRV